MFRAIIAESTGVLSFHAAETSAATTKAFTHGGIIFDPQAGTVTIARRPPLPIPAGLKLEPGRPLTLGLIAPDGTPRPQQRFGVLVEGAHGVLRIPGIRRTPSSRTAEEGWVYTSRTYRAYMTHPGAPGTPCLPEWLIQSIARQRQLWNAIAIQCRAALRQCSEVSPEEIREFVRGTILPAIDTFNGTLVRGPRIKHPRDLKVEEPSLADVRRFAGRLSLRAKKGIPVPENLEQTVVQWANSHAADYTPIRVFEKDLDRLISQEAQALHLRFWERRAVANALLAAIARRRNRNLPFTSGWPKPVRADEPRAENWGIYYYLNSATIPGQAVLDGGVRSLRLGEPLPPEQTGHPNAYGKRFGIRRQFRAVEIAIPDRASGEIWRLDFSIVQHQPIPKDSFLKEWRLACTRGKLQLILALQAKSAAPPKIGAGGPVAGMDLGWRREGCGIRVATVFNPVADSYTTIFVDLENRAPDTANRTPFRVFMGPSRRGLRDAAAAERAGQLVSLDTYEGCRELQRARAAAREQLKSEIRALLGNRAPAWLERAGARGLRSLKETSGDPALNELIVSWLTEEDRLASVYREYSGRVRARLRKGYERVAHDLGRMLQADGVQLLAVEDRFLAQAARATPDALSGTLRGAAHYRQWVAPGSLVQVLEQILPVCGIRVERRTAKDTSRRCHACGALNDIGAALHFQCSQCGLLLDQDKNAARNLASGTPEGREPGNRVVS